MRVLVDTSVLSLAFRRSRPELLSAADRAIVNGLRKLSDDDDVVLIGAIRQEALSGIKTEAQFKRIRTLLDGFQYVPTGLVDHDGAAGAFNQCRSRGIAAGPIDMLICASAQRHGLPIFTVDPDFRRYARVLPIRLYDPPP